VWCRSVPVAIDDNVIVIIIYRIDSFIANANSHRLL
jgi:hypothetical protein